MLHLGVTLVASTLGQEAGIFTACELSVGGEGQFFYSHLYSGEVFSSHPRPPFGRHSGYVPERHT
jgi:hypothetical protein